jgi:hypothetical protein
MVWAVAPERYWRYQIDQWHDPTAIGTQSGVQMLVDRAGAVQGYLVVAAKRWAPELDVYAMDVAPGVNARAVMPPVLRALQAYGMEVPDVFDSGPLREIAFHLGRSHPIYEALGQDLAPFYEPPYAWYVRVPDVPRFLLHIAPALERRLAASAAAGYSGELKLDCYRGGLRMVFEQGRISTVERWSVPTFGSEAGAGCPELVFLQLLFGYRGLDELRHVFPDVWASGEAAVLLKALFSARESWVIPWG